jgi:hypothetical protein
MAPRSPTSLGPAVTKFLEDILAPSMAKQDAILLHVALDGSGHVHRDRFLAFGVVAGLAPHWQRFHAEWGKLLDKYDLTHIRMTDAVSFEGPFRAKATQWGHQRSEVRDRVLSEAAEVITRYLKVGGCSADFADLPSEKTYRYKKKVLFQYMVHMLLEAEPDYVLAFLCDDEQDSAPAFYKLLSSFKLRYQDLAPRLSGICFFDDIRMSQIQAADIVAWVFRDRHRREVEQPGCSATELETVLLANTTTRRDAVTLRVPRPREGHERNHRMPPPRDSA